MVAARSLFPAPFEGFPRELIGISFAPPRLVRLIATVNRQQ